MGAFLSGGTDPEQHFTPIKDHESVAERQAREGFANQQALEVSREDFEKNLHASDNAARLTEAGIVQSHEESRAKSNNATQLGVANIYAGSAQLGRALELRNQALAEKQQTIDDAIAAASTVSANGSIDANRAHNAIPSAVRQKYQIGPADMNAGLARFRDRKAALERERQQTQLSVAKTKHASWVDGPSPVSGDATTTSGASGSLSDADLWERYRSQGLSAAEATARVKARSSSSSSGALMEQRRAYDAAARAALAKGKDPVTVLGRRP